MPPWRVAKSMQPVLGAFETSPSDESLQHLPLGSIIGVVNVEKCIRDSRSTWAEKGFWHRVLSNPRPRKRKCLTGYEQAGSANQGDT